jgi:hypothetical protein
MNSLSAIPLTHYNATYNFSSERIFGDCQIELVGSLRVEIHFIESSVHRLASDLAIHASDSDKWPIHPYAI